MLSGVTLTRVGNKWGVEWGYYTDQGDAEMVGYKWGGSGVTTLTRVGYKWGVYTYQGDAEAPHIRADVVALVVSLRVNPFWLQTHSRNIERNTHGI